MAKTGRRLNSAPLGQSNRHGLAMLEMVLALPLLMAVMALIVNFGTASSWNVRGALSAKHTAWAGRFPRVPQAFPPCVGSAGINEVRTVGPIYAQDLDPPILRHPVVRGPLPRDIEVNEDLLNCNRGLLLGDATVEREFPMLNFGWYRLQPGTRVLSGDWQYGEMGMRHNGQRRIPVIYDLPEAPARLVRAYLRAVEAILHPDLQWALRSLDHDDEFIAYGRRFCDSVIMTWSDAPPDFHPTLGQFCDGTPDVVQKHVDKLLMQIAGVPKNLARGFIALYERAITELDWRITHDPSLSPSDILSMQAEIVLLQHKIGALETFLQSMS